MPDMSAPFSRRNLLRGAVGLGGAAEASMFLPRSVRAAMTSANAPQPGTGSINDIEHIVILMQENRSFDHYFGTMPGVRGFWDPNAMTLPDGNPVYYQPDPNHADGYLMPFRLDTKTTRAQANASLPHGWVDQHYAYNADDTMDAWIANKTEWTMGYFDQEDIPFHRALAQAFTICDAYHCSVLGPTNPNRLYMWTGMLDPLGTGGGPALDDSDGPYWWTTYPELLTAAGITWQVYQEPDNYDDNALWWFTQYWAAQPGEPLFEGAMRRRPAGWFENDAKNDNLPQVSWLIAPSTQSEHPNWGPSAGAQYIAQKIDAIAANPDVWAKTAFILTYDENDGLFDHVNPPLAPASDSEEEWVIGGGVDFAMPIGLGYRVPCIIVSPWTVGGRVCTDVFDHTSLIQFIEARFGVQEPNISAWRRQTCGDLTSAFQFGTPAKYPSSNKALSVDVTTAGLLEAMQEIESNPAPVIPSVNAFPARPASKETTD